MELKLMPLTDIDLNLLNTFNCPSQDDFIARFLKKDSNEMHKKNIVKTHVLVENDTRVIGYFSLFLDHIEVLKSKRDQQKWEGLNQNMFPSVRIHAIGIDKDYQRKRLGERLLGAATFYCVDIAETAGCTFINLEATSDSVSFYEKYGFVKLRRINSRLTHMLLRIEDIEI